MAPRPFVVAGLDPTAGTWESGMTAGPRPMDVVALAGNGEAGGLRLLARARPTTNAEVWAFCRAAGAEILAIDGPCGTAGLRMRPGARGWGACAGGTRDAERALAREGFALFWTTAATVRRFDGASRWIARSLRLFRDRAAPAGLVRIETYPHAAFAILHAAGGGRGALPVKSSPRGRAARLASLRRFVPGLPDGALPGPDAVDAACVALVAALHRLGATRALGSVRRGGRIWLPRPEAPPLRAGPRSRIHRRR